MIGTMMNPPPTPMMAAEHAHQDAEHQGHEHGQAHART